MGKGIRGLTVQDVDFVFIHVFSGTFPIPTLFISAVPLTWSPWFSSASPKIMLSVYFGGLGISYSHRLQ